MIPNNTSKTITSDKSKSGIDNIFDSDSTIRILKIAEISIIILHNLYINHNKHNSSGSYISYLMIFNVHFGTHMLAGL